MLARMGVDTVIVFFSELKMFSAVGNVLLKAKTIQ